MWESLLKDVVTVPGGGVLVECTKTVPGGGVLVEGCGSNLLSDKSSL